MSKNHNSTKTEARKALIEYIYSRVFTDRFVHWLFATRQRTARTFARKYQDPVARHEDVTEFIVSKKFQTLQITEPGLFDIDVWIDRTDAFSQLRNRFFTIYRNFTINRWKRYQLVTSRELQIFTTENSIEDTMANDTNPDIMNALIYRQAWNQYTSNLDAADKMIALYLLKGSISMAALEKAVGLKKSQIYLRIQIIEADIQALISSLIGV